MERICAFSKGYYLCNEIIKRKRMKYSLDRREKYSIFKVEEDRIDSTISPDLKSQFIFLKNEGVPNLIVDMSGVEYIDSSGLSAILTANRLWKDEGVFILSNIDNANVQKIIRISRLDSILNITDDIQGAENRILIEQVEKLVSEEE